MVERRFGPLIVGVVAVVVGMIVGAITSTAASSISGEVYCDELPCSCDQCGCEQPSSSCFDPWLPRSCCDLPLLKELAGRLPDKEVARIVSRATGERKNLLYQRLLEIAALRSQ